MKPATTCINLPWIKLQPTATQGLSLVRFITRCKTTPNSDEEAASLNVLRSLALTQDHFENLSIKEETHMKTLVALALALVLAASMAFAHSGGTDSSGCHHERKTGGYHCH